MLRSGPVTVFLGDARDVLAGLPSASIDCCLTSPPYWGLRDYRLPPLVWGGDEGCLHRWGTMQRGNRGDIRPGDLTRLNARIDTTGRQGRAALNGGRFCQLCGAWLGGLGLEPTPQLYVQHLVEVFRHVRRTLKPTATVWLVLGDSYSGSGLPAKHLGLAAWSAVHGRGGAHKQERAGALRRQVAPGLKPKDLVGIPWRVAFALQADGWWLRSEIVWSKPNPTPESVRDRPTRSHEHVFLLSASRRYFYDAVAVRKPCASGPSAIRKMVERLPRIGGKHKYLVDPFVKASASTNIGRWRSVGSPSGRRLRSVQLTALPQPRADEVVDGGADVDMRRALMEGEAGLPTTGEVRVGGRSSLPFFVTDSAGDEVEAISAFLTHLALSEMSPLTCRSYAHDLLRWWRLLTALKVEWTDATTAEVAVLVGWLRSARNGQRQRRSGVVPGAVNPKTGKSSLPDGYAPSTINHGLAALYSFYAFHAHYGRGPVVNPVRYGRSGAPCWRTAAPSTHRRRRRAPRCARKSSTAYRGPSLTRCGRSCSRP